MKRLITIFLFLGLTLLVFSISAYADEVIIQESDMTPGDGGLYGSGPPNIDDIDEYYEDDPWSESRMSNDQEDPFDLSNEGFKDNCWGLLSGLAIYFFTH